MGPLRPTPLRFTPRHSTPLHSTQLPSSLQDPPKPNNLSQDGILPLRPPHPPRHHHCCGRYAQPASGVHGWSRRLSPNPRRTSSSTSTSTTTPCTSTCSGSVCRCTSTIAFSRQHEIPWVQHSSHPASSTTTSLRRLWPLPSSCQH